MRNCNINENQNTNRQATTPSVLCGWSKNKQKKVKTKNCECFVGKEQLESCCGKSVQKKVQNQWVDVLDYIKTIKTTREFVIKKPNKMKFSLSFNSFIVLNNRNMRMKAMKSNKL